MQNQLQNKSFPKSIHEKLAFYVYIYVDTSNNLEKVVYVGKGKGNRCFDHLDLSDVKSKNIKSLIKSGNLRIDVLVHGINEETAIKVEAAVIDLVGIEPLLNKQRGHGSKVYGRITSDDLIAKLKPRESLDSKDFEDDCILIRITKRYYSTMSPIDLYEWTRGIWRASMSSCEKAKYALAINDGIVREVYLVAGWFHAGETIQNREGYDPFEENYEQDSERVEFVGRLADDDIREKYIAKDVSNLWSNGAQNPITYFGPSYIKKSNKQLGKSKV